MLARLNGLIIVYCISCVITCGLKSTLYVDRWYQIGRIIKPWKHYWWLLNLSRINYYWRFRLSTRNPRESWYKFMSEASCDLSRFAIPNWKQSARKEPLKYSWIKSTKKQFHKLLPKEMRTFHWRSSVFSGSTFYCFAEEILQLGKFPFSCL